MSLTIKPSRFAPGPNRACIRMNGNGLTVLQRTDSVLVPPVMTTTYLAFAFAIYRQRGGQTSR